MSERLRASQVDALVARDTNLRGRRVRNAADALLAQDYVTLKQLESYIAVAIKEIIFPIIDVQNFPSLFYYAQADLPTDWGFAQQYYLVWVTDYHHLLVWEGANWNWGPGDSRNAGELAFFDSDPGTGWKLIDGNGDDGSAIGASHPIKILKSDGTTRDITTLDQLYGYLKGAAAFSGTLTAATAPAISGNSGTGNANLGLPTATTVVQSGTGTTVAGSTHVHSDSGHTHGVGTYVNDLSGGDPVDYMEALPYIRK